MTAGIVATALVVWPAAPFFLFMHGNDITIPKGTEITAYINGNSPLDKQKFLRATESTAAQDTAPTTTTSTMQITLTISSNPAGADIELDGSFVGDTPSSVGVAQGDHDIKIKKSGYVMWEKRIRVSTGVVNISADLQPVDAGPVK